MGIYTNVLLRQLTQPQPLFAALFDCQHRELTGEPGYQRIPVSDFTEQRDYSWQIHEGWNRAPCFFAIIRGSGEALTYVPISRWFGLADGSLDPNLLHPGDTINVSHRIDLDSSNTHAPTIEPPQPGTPAVQEERPYVDPLPLGRVIDTGE